MPDSSFAENAIRNPGVTAWRDGVSKVALLSGGDATSAVLFDVEWQSAMRLPLPVTCARSEGYEEDIGVYT
jgi:hypothetical protein